MTKLQYALAYTPEQIAALPPPLMRIRELEEKVGALVRENEELRRQVEQRNADLRPDIVRQPSYRTSFDDRHTDRGDIKRRRTIDHGELYVVSAVVHSVISLSGPGNNQYRTKLNISSRLHPRHLQSLPCLSSMLVMNDSSLKSSHLIRLIWITH